MPTFPTRLLAALAVVLVVGGPARADVKLPRVIGPNMVLQRDTPARVWGWAEPGEKVTVTLGDHTATATADKNRCWEVTLPAMKAGGPFELVVTGVNTVKVPNVLVGEVWFCSGQSNMALGVVKTLNADKEIAAADFPKIRLFTAPTRESKEPTDDVAADWLVCSPKTVSYFSAAAYYFGRELHQKLGVPVGLVVSAVNGTRIE
ncbi:MAG: hypothetical protein K2V38_28715, partial [Gemmataceae bacterium]|nr:hypothetical protein [Gemmataceae bacterium]